MVKSSLARLVLYLIAVLVVASLLVNVALAYTYEAPITVTGGPTTSYAMLPVVASVDNDYLAVHGYISSSANDTRVLDIGTEVPRLVSDSKLLFAIPLAAGTTKNDQYTFGNTAEATMPIVLGYNGFITINDVPALELGNNFASSINDCYTDTVTGTGYIIDKQNAFDFYVSNTATQTVTALIGGRGQVIRGGSGVVGGANNFNCLMGTGPWNATEYVNYQAVPTAGSISTLYIRLSANVAAGATITFTVYKNAAPTAVAATVSAGTSTGSDLINSASFVAGDTVSIKETQTGAPGNPAVQWASLWTPTVPGESIFLANVTCSIANTYYYIPQGQCTTGQMSELMESAPMPTNGTFSKLYVKLSADPGTAPDAYKFMFRKAAADSTLTTTIVADATTGSDTTHSVAVVAGDSVALQVVPTDTPTVASIAAIGMVFTPTVIGESVIIGGGSRDPSAAAVNYQMLQGSVDLYAWNATESTFYQLTQVSILSKLYVRLYQSPQNGAGVQSCTYNVREAVGNTGLTVTISEDATTGNDVVHTYQSANGAIVAMQSTPSGTPRGSVMPTWGVVSNNILASVSVAGVTLDEHDYIISLSGGTFSLQVDAGAPSTTAFAGSVPDRSSAWVLMGNSTPYLDYYSHTVGGVEVIRYEPNSIIVCTDEAGTADAGTTTTLDDAILTQADDYWIGARLIITDTTDDLAPKGEIAVVTDFIAANDRLAFADLTAAVGAGDTYTISFGTLPNELAPGTYDGRTTWGANPTDITVTVGGLLSTGLPPATGAGADTPALAPTSPGEGMYGGGSSGAGFPGQGWVLWVVDTLNDAFPGADFTTTWVWSLLAMLLVTFAAVFMAIKYRNLVPVAVAVVIFTALLWKVGFVDWWAIPATTTFMAVLITLTKVHTFGG